MAGVSTGRPCAFFVHGEPGVGKTRLVEDACLDAEQRGYVVLWGRCVHFAAASTPYTPLVTAIEGWLATAEEPVRTEVKGELDAVAVGDDNVLPGRVGQLVERVLARIEAYSPVVLVLDDIQWADVSSLDVVAYLVAGFRRQRFALLMTFRDTELEEGHPLHGWLADLRRLPAVHDLSLQRLDQPGTREQLRLLGCSADDRLLRQVYIRSDGNPYLTELLVRDLPPGATTLPPGVPEELRAVLLATWHRLSPAGRHVTRLLAVGGRPLPHRIVAQVGEEVGLAPEALAAALGEANRGGVLQAGADGTTWFRHPLLAEVLHASFLPGEASPLHAAFVRVLEGAEPTDEADRMQWLSDLAVHHGSSGDPDAAFVYSIDAADHAVRLQGYPEQVGHLARAVGLLSQVTRKVVDGSGGEAGLLERAAFACSRSGDVQAAYRLVNRALSLVERTADPLTVSRLLVEWCELVWVNGMVDKKPLAQSLEAVELSTAVPDSTEHAVALARLAEAEVWSGLREQALEHAQRAVAAAERSGSAAARSQALAARAFAHLGDTSAWSDVEEAYRWAREAADPLVMAGACTRRVNYLAGHGRLREAVPVEAEGFAVSAATGARAYQAFFAGAAALDSLRLGRLDDARAWLREGLATWSVGIGAMNVRRAAATLALREGRTAEAREHLERLRELTPSFDAHVGVHGPLLLAEFHLARGAPQAALTVVEDNLATQASVDPRVGDELLVWGARAAADLAQRGRDSDEPATVTQARLRLSALEEDRAALPGPAFEPADRDDLVQPAMAALFAAERARCLGAPEALALWQRAVEACTRAGLRWEEAVARWRHVEGLLATGADHGAVAGALRRAHELVTVIGSGPLRAELEALARSARISLARPAPEQDHPNGSRLNGLTRREREVLAHLVAGRSYSEIAEALYISDKTVSVHVSNLLRKTGTRNRNEAAAFGRRNGLAADQIGGVEA